MYRARIALAAAAVVAVLTVVVVSSVGSSLKGVATRQAQQQTEHAQLAFPSLDLLRGIELTNETAKMAREDEFAEALAKASEEEVRKASFVAVETRNGRLEKAGRKADIVVVVGAHGRVICRDLNINALFDEEWKAKYPAVAKALEGVANKDVWNLQGQMYRVAAAPIRGRSGIAGALVIGYVTSANDSQHDREKLGSEVALFLDGKVHASSFRKSGGESEEEKALATQLFGGPKHADPALAGERSKPFRVELLGEEYVAAVGPLPGNLTKSKSGYVVLTSLTQARAATAGVTSWVLLLGIVGLLAAVGAAVMTALRFIRPLDTLESGVAEVINGNHDYSFESPSQDYEGLANGLNVMIARLTGRPDPSEDDTGENEKWSPGELAVDEVASTTGPQVSPENAALAAEADDSYLKRTYEEWTAARTQTGEGTEGMSFEAFVAKIRQNDAALRKKYNAKLVRFKVVIKNDQATLKPVPIA